MKRTINVIQDSISVTKTDSLRLKELFKTHKVVDPELKRSLEKLKENIRKAKLLEDSVAPKNLIRINSVITISTTFGRKVGLQIVLPDDANFQERKLSILSPLGVSLFGSYEGMETIWEFRRGNEWIFIEKVDNFNHAS